MRYSIPKKPILMDMDAGIKFFLFATIIIATVVCKDYMSFLLIFIFCGLFTILSGVKKNAVLKNLMLFVFIILIPYTFGIMVTELVNVLKYGKLLYVGEEIKDLSVRVLRLFLISYISTLYLQSTSINVVISFFEKLLSPLSHLKIPVSDYLKILLIIINRIFKSIDEFNDSIIRNFKEMRKEKGYAIKEYFKFIARFIADLTVNSLSKVNEVQNTIEEEFKNDLDAYKFKISASDLIGGCIFIIMLLLIIAIEA